MQAEGGLRRAARYFSSLAPQTDSPEALVPTTPTRHTGKINTKTNIHDAVKMIKDLSWAKFDETIEITVQMGLDPRKPNQAVKGVASLPNGTGKTVRVCVFASGDDALAAREAGAEVVGAEDLVAGILAGNLNFDTVIATPDMMSVLGKLGRVLGPRGLMPNPKMGTVTKDVARAVVAAKAGAVKFKVEKKGIIQGGVGKKSFSDAALLGNIRAFMLAIIEVKPDGLKGKYLRSASISSSMGPGIPLELPSVDPGSARFMLNLAAKKE
ncbi:ribosomal protein L1-like protein [Ochromonadaceae sp. CCMP2298]|nr:ribosomal protein L1-like protein [Ochromonadaceae sp. CCMP2298]